MTIFAFRKKVPSLSILPTIIKEANYLRMNQLCRTLPKSAELTLQHVFVTRLPASPRSSRVTRQDDDPLKTRRDDDPLKVELVENVKKTSEWNLLVDTIGNRHDHLHQGHANAEES